MMYGKGLVYPIDQSMSADVSVQWERGWSFHSCSWCLLTDRVGSESRVHVSTTSYGFCRRAYISDRHDDTTTPPLDS